jgi:hypothetical protein
MPRLTFTLLALVLCSTVNAQHVELTPPVERVAFQPISVAHLPNEQVAVTAIETGNLVPEASMVRLADHTVFVVDVGTYLIKSGSRCALIQVVSPSTATDSPPPTPPTPQPTRLSVWAYMGNRCEPCDLWKANELAILQATPGVSVYVVPHGQHKKTRTPTFILSAAGRVVEREGYDINLNTATQMLQFAQ